MKKSTDFHDFIVFDLLSRLDDITSQHMMSGWCIYSNRIPFAAIIENRLYLKTKNPETIEELKSFESEKFHYEKKDGRIVSMNYWSMPDEKLDDMEFVQKMCEQVIEENLPTK